MPGMLKNYPAVWSGLFQFCDLSVIVLTGILAGWWYLPTHEFHSMGYAQLMAIGMLLAAVVFNRFGAYEARRGRSLFEELRLIGLSWLAVVLALSVFVFFTKSGQEYSRVWAGLWFFGGLAGLLFLRVTIRWVLRSLRRHGYNQRHVLIVGYDHLIRELKTRFQSAPWLGLQVTETVNVDQVSIPTLVGLVNAGQVDQVWIVLPLKEETRLRELIDGLAMTSVEVKYVPDLFGFRLFSHSLSEVGGLPVLNLCSTPMQGLNQVIKAVEDRVLSVLFLLILSPVILLVALGVKLSSPGPVFFKQARLGLGGKVIHVLKFRSMVVHAESAGKVTQATRADPRITPFGAFIRRTSLDELPQFFNVLLGDMSIVGPRPHALAHNDEYKDLVDDYMHRHRVKPGITGWAQVNGFRGETDTLDKMQRRVEYDLYYIQHWSIWFDLKIIVLTVFKGFLNKNAY